MGLRFDQARDCLGRRRRLRVAVPRAVIAFYHCDATARPQHSRERAKCRHRLRQVFQHKTDEDVIEQAIAEREPEDVARVKRRIAAARRFGSRVVFMHEGRIHEQGPAAAVLAEPKTPELQTFLSAVLH